MTAASWQGVGTRFNSAGATSAAPATTTTGITPGDIIFAIVGVKNASDHTSSSGWTRIGYQNASSSWSASLWAYKVQSGVAIPDLVVSWTGSSANFAQTWSVEREDLEPYLPVTSAFGSIVAGSGTAAPQAVSAFTAAASNSLAMYAAACQGNTGYSAVTSYTERVDNGSSTGTTRNVVGTRTLTSAGDDSGAISTTSGSGHWGMWLVEIKEPVFDGTTVGVLNSGDGVQIGTSAPTTSSTPLNQGWDGTNENRIVLRFASLNIPTGQRIKQAWIKLSRTTAAPTGTIWGNLYGDLYPGSAPTWATEGINDARRSVASTPFIAGVANNSMMLDVTDQLQEITTTAGWADGNAVRFFGGAGGTSPDGLLPFFASESGGSNAPKLFVAWEPQVAGGGLTASTGVFTYSGLGANLLHGWQLPAQPGSFALTPTTTELRKGLTLLAGSSVFTYSGLGANLLHGWLLPVQPGSFALTPTTTELRKGLTLPAGASVFSLTPSEAFLRHGWLLPAQPGAFTLVAPNTILRYARTAQLGTGTLALAAPPVTFVRSRRLELAAGALSFAAPTTNLFRTHRLVADTGSVVFFGLAAALQRGGGGLTAARGQFNLVAPETFLRYGHTLPAQAGAFTATGVASAVRQTRALPAAPTTYSAVFRDAVLLRSRALQADPAAYTLSTPATELGSVLRFIAGVGSFLLNPRAALLALKRHLRADAAAFQLTGSADLNLTGPVSLTPPSARIYTPFFENRIIVFPTENRIMLAPRQLFADRVIAP